MKTSLLATTVSVECYLVAVVFCGFQAHDTLWAELVFNLLEERLTAVQKERDWRSEARFTFSFWSFSGNTAFAAVKWSLSRGRSERERQFALSPNSRTPPRLSARRSCSSLTGNAAEIQFSGYNSVWSGARVNVTEHQNLTDTISCRCVSTERDAGTPLHVNFMSLLGCCQVVSYSLQQGFSIFLMPQIWSEIPSLKFKRQLCIFMYKYPTNIQQIIL